MFGRRERRLHHLAIGTADVERLARFYREAFGLAERARFHDEDGDALRSIWLTLSDGVLMLERSAQPVRRVSGIGSGPFLLAFEVAETERNELERRLESLGAPIDDRTRFTSYARDPDGNRVAISHYPLPDPDAGDAPSRPT